MRFHVRRVICSDYRDKPKLKARWAKKIYRDDYVETDERTASSPDKIPAFRNESTDWWYSEGRNHRVEKGHIKRDFDQKAWFLDIDTIEELMEFYQSHGRVLIEPMFSSESETTLLIADGYLD